MYKFTSMSILLCHVLFFNCKGDHRRSFYIAKREYESGIVSEIKVIPSCYFKCNSRHDCLAVIENRKTGKCRIVEKTQDLHKDIGEHDVILERLQRISDLPNLALGMNTAQSSTGGKASWGWFGHSKYAVDGIKETNHLTTTCQHTNNEFFPWWRVDLGRLAHVYSVSITNRGDCCAERLTNFDVRVGNSLDNNGNNNALCKHGSTVPLGQTKEFVCSTLLTGKYVNIQILQLGILTLCEVEVSGSFGIPPLK